jgi:hypothetical protein
MHEPLHVSTGGPRLHRHAIPVPSVHGHSLVAPRELIGLAFLLAAYGASLADTQKDFVQLLNIVGPSALAVILLLGCWWQFAGERRSLWQPLFWFRLACVTYFGVGALVPYVANDTIVQSIQSLYACSDEEEFKVGLINVCCILTVLLAAAVFSRQRNLLNRSPAPKRRGASQSNILLFAAVFLIVGGITRYLIVLPSSLGLTDIVPGLVLPLAKSYVVGLFLLVLAGLRGSRIALVLAMVLIPIDLGLGLLTFAKTEVLITLIFSYLGVLHHKLTVSRTLVGAAIVLAVYSQLDPIIHFGRNELQRRYGSLEGPLDQRLDLLNLYLGGAYKVAGEPETQSTLSRLSYVNAATMVVSWRDSGRTGETLDYALTVFVPRFIWPDKPVISSVGTELYTAATGQIGSSISPGLFAEAYWNLGWLGIPVLMVPLGIILAVFSRYSLAMVGQERWLHMPVILLGVLAGFRVDGWYVVDILGGCGIALALGLAIFALENTLVPWIAMTLTGSSHVQCRHRAHC